MENLNNPIMQDAIAKANKEIEKARIACAISESLPIELSADIPRIFVYSLYKSVASVTYKAKTKGEAFRIYKAFAPLPAFVCRDGSVSIKPFDDEKAQSVSEIHAWVKIDQHESNLCWFANSPEGIIRFEVELPVSIFGRYVRSDSRAKIHFKMNWQPLPETCEMYLAVSYAPAYREGPQSGGQKIYALYDQYEVTNQFEGV